MWLSATIFVPLLLLGILQLMPAAEGVCCYPRTITFQLTDDTEECSFYINARSYGRTRCLVSICNDGSEIRGSYCGLGECNIFGCNCDGGCRKGDAVQSFSDLYGDYNIRNVKLI